MAMVIRHIYSWSAQRSSGDPSHIVYPSSPIYELSLFLFLHCGRHLRRCGDPFLHVATHRWSPEIFPLPHSNFLQADGRPPGQATRLSLSTSISWSCRTSPFTLKNSPKESSIQVPDPNFVSKKNRIMLNKGSHPVKKVQFFLTLFKRGGWGEVKPMFKNYVVNFV